LTLLLGVVTYIDFAFIGIGGDAGPAFVILRLLERAALAILLFAGIFTATTRSLEHPILDDRPAQWILYAILAGLGVFLLHNLVDFSLFEIGPMFLFALLAGSALGMRTGSADESAKTTSSKHLRVAGLAVACVAWLGFAIALALPVIAAEGHAADGDEALRQSRGPQAAQAYAAAAAAVPYNADYHLSEAHMFHAMHDVERARRAYDAAAAASPLDAHYRVARAALEASLPNPDVARIRADYDAAIAMDPASVSGRLDYAELLEKLGFPADARTQYEQALWYNDRLPPDEVKRLPAARVAEIQQKITQLGR
jgi:tetratricopeptide (TPR) repeat protein